MTSYVILKYGLQESTGRRVVLKDVLLVLSSLFLENPLIAWVVWVVWVVWVALAAWTAREMKAVVERSMN